MTRLAMLRQPNSPVARAGLRRRAEARVRKQQGNRRPGAGAPKSEVDTRRLLHELQVHQVELEMQNTALQEAREQLETLLEKYTDLYDFAPVGYFSLDDRGRILEVNLTGAAWLGVERSRLINRSLPQFLAPPSQSVFRAFLGRVFAGSGKQVCEAALRKEGGSVCWADFHANAAISLGASGAWCRVAVSDITVLKRAEEAQRRAEALAVANRELRREIVRRHAVEEALKQSERHQSRLLEQSRHMQEQLRHMSHRILQAQEDERKQISRELHDEITQTLVGISFHLETLAREATINPTRLKQRIVRTQRFVEKSVNIVHQFARQLRPTALDDLGLIPALRSLVKDFSKRTGVRVEFTVCAGVEELDNVRQTVLYRVAQSALTNVGQHAQASRVKVSIRRLKDAVRMDIADNGRSFDVERVLRDGAPRHLGLLGMRERVEMVGGTLTIDSRRGRGTTIRADLAVGRKRGRRAGVPPESPPANG